jgi:hypothetical protein
VASASLATSWPTVRWSESQRRLRNGKEKRRAPAALRQYRRPTRSRSRMLARPLAVQTARASAALEPTPIVALPTRTSSDRAMLPEVHPLERAAAPRAVRSLATLVTQRSSPIAEFRALHPGSGSLPPSREQTRAWQGSRGPPAGQLFGQGYAVVRSAVLVSRLTKALLGIDRWLHRTFGSRDRKLYAICQR